MHNWRLLLLAFVAVFQPIASFSERGVDGRRCDYRTSLLQDLGVQFHGTYRFTKPAEDRRLNQREDVRRIRHNEVRGEFRTPLHSRIADATEKGDRSLPSLGRFSLAKYRLTRDAPGLTRETRDERSSEIRRARQTTRDNRVSAFDDERQISGRRASARLPMERRLESQRNQEAQRVREIRNMITASDRVRDDASTRNARRITRERTPRNDMRRSETRMELERNANREMKRATEFRDSLTTRLNRDSENEDRSIRKDQISLSLDRDERRSTRSRRTLDNERLQRTQRSRDSILRETVVDDRMVRDLSARLKELQSDQTIENRRNFSYREARFRGSRVVETERETRNNERDTRLTRATSLEEGRVSSRISERGCSIESRRGENVIRNMERDRTSERTVENRRNVRSQDRENQRTMRNTARGLREVRLDRERATEVRGEIRYVSRQSCTLNNERNAERRSSERVNRFSTERDAQNQRSSRNLELQRDADEKATREVRRESLLGRNIRINFENTRSVENQHSQDARRDTRNIESRSITIGNENRRNDDRRSRSLDRIVDSRRDTRENRDARILRQKRSSETRESDRVTRATRDMSEENRHSIQERQSRITREEHNFANHRAIRTAEITQLESSAESRRDIRKADMGNRRAARNTEKDFRTVRGDETRVIRARDALSMDRKSSRATERLVTRDTPVDSKRTRSIDESRRVSENMDLERRAATRFNAEMTRKREFLSATGKNENVTFQMNWQYLFYALQGVYLCGILTQVMNEKTADMKSRSLSWWSMPQHLIKVD